MPAALALTIFALAAAPCSRCAGPGYLGVSVRAAARGLEVLRVVEGGPCAAAGVRRGDVLSKLGGRRLRAVEDLDRGLAAAGDARRLALELWRGGRSVKLTVRTDRRPPAPSALAPSASPSPSLGARARTPSARELETKVRALRDELAALRVLVERLRRARE